MLMKLEKKIITWDKELTATELLGYINDKNWTGVFKIYF